MEKSISRLRRVYALIIVFIASASMTGVDTPALAEESQELTLSLRLPSSTAVEQIPLFSEKYAQTPVALVNGEPITMEEFATQLAEMHSNVDQSAERSRTDFFSLLDRMIAVKLGVLESVNIGLDQTPAALKQIDDFALQTMIQQLIGKQLKNIELDGEKVEELYKKMALEAKLTTFTFPQQEDAQSLLDQYQAGADFQQLAQAMVENGKAEAGDADYVKLKDLLPNVAQAVYEMDPGKVSEIFRTDKKFLLFKLEDRRGYEDDEARLEASRIVLEQQAREKQAAFFKTLEEKYVVINKEAEESLDFEKIAQNNPGAKASEVFAKLRLDQRPLATIKNNEETRIITVEEIVKELEATYFHGTEVPLAPQDNNAKRDNIIQEKLIKITGEIEAKNQGIDQSKEYLNAVAKFRENLLFGAFMNKAVLPGVKVSQAEAREYYQANIGDYSTPLMLKLKSLVFTDETGAQDALKKLRAGSDFKWVSGNVTGLATEDDPNYLNFGLSLLAISALPEELQKMAANARQNDLFLYHDPGNLFYVLHVEAAFPPQAKPYEEVQNEAAKIVYGRKIKEALDAYVGKLKKVYETKIFLVD